MYMLHSGYKTIKHGSGLLNADSGLFENPQRANYRPKSSDNHK